MALRFLPRRSVFLTAVAAALALPASAGAATYNLRPDSTFSASGWTTTPAAPHWDVINDAVTQPALPTTATDYASSASGSAMATYVENPTIGAGETVNGVTLRAYLAAGSNRAVILFLTHTTNVTIANTTIPAGSPAGWYSVSYAGALTQAQLDSLYLGFTPQGSGGSTPAVVYAAYAEVTTTDPAPPPPPSDPPPSDPPPSDPPPSDPPPSDPPPSDPPPSDPPPSDPPPSDPPPSDPPPSDPPPSDPPPSDPPPSDPPPSDPPAENPPPSDPPAKNPPPSDPPAADPPAADPPAADPPPSDSPADPAPAQDPAPTDPVPTPTDPTPTPEAPPVTPTDPGDDIVEPALAITGTSTTATPQGDVPVTVGCAADMVDGCAGVMWLEEPLDVSGSQIRAARRTPKRFSKNKRYKLKPGQRKTIPIRLDRRTYRKFKKKRSFKVAVVAQQKDAGGQVVTQRRTFRVYNNKKKRRN
jgi:hypothetical protein